MRTAIRLEEFGSTEFMGFDKSKPWIAKISGFDETFGYKREFISFRRDYSAASSTGNRGIWRYYALEPGLYEINQRKSWKYVRRYFILVDNTGNFRELSSAEVNEWLTKNILE